MASRLHLISTHVTPYKERALATALLQMSETKGLQDDVVLENVVYCGDKEPLNGWNNIAPTAKYTDVNRPKVNNKKKRAMKKLQNSESRDSLGDDIYAELLGMATRADGHYHSSASIQQLYEDYRKREWIKSSSKRNGMIDPISFRYVPFDERDEEDRYAGAFKLPVLKMTHADQQSRLMRLLESYINRKHEAKHNHETAEREKYSINTQDALSFYDKYRWYFKNKQSVLPKVPSSKRQSKTRNRRLTSLGTGSFVDYESDVLAEKSKRRKRMVPPSYVIRVRTDDKKNEREDTITFERKTDYGLCAPGGPGIERWVAHVAMKETNEPDIRSGQRSTSQNSSSDESRITESTVSRFVTEKKRSLFRASNVDDKGRTNLRYVVRTQEQSFANEPEYRLKSKQRNSKRSSKKLPKNFYNLYNIASEIIETAKVSVKYDVTVEKKKGMVRESSTDASDANQLKENKNGKTKAVGNALKPMPIHSQQNVVPGSNLKVETHQVLSLTKRRDGIRLPSLYNSANVLADERDNNKTASANGFSKKKINRNGSGQKKNGCERNARHNETKNKNHDEKSPLSLIQESSDERQVKSPSSSTFNPDRMFRQMRDTAQFIDETPLRKPGLMSDLSSNKFSTRSDSKSGDSRSTSNSDASSKPIHPRKNIQNRGQNKLQRIIDEEKSFVSEVIKQLNSKDSLDSKNNQLTPVPESIQEALSTAIAKARLVDKRNAAVGPSSRRGAMDPIMKRRIVRPIPKEKTPVGKHRESATNTPAAINTAIVGSYNKFFITETTRMTPSNKKRLPVNAKLRTTISKKTNSKNTGLTNNVRSLSQDRNESFKKQAYKPTGEFGAGGDLANASKRRPRQVIPGHFEASISSIKPVRRIANIPRIEVKQKV